MDTIAECIRPTVKITFTVVFNYYNVLLLKHKLHVSEFFFNINMDFICFGLTGGISTCYHVCDYPSIAIIVKIRQRI